GLADIYKELRLFFTQSSYPLPGNLFSRNQLNPGFHVQPGFVQLPRYLGGALLGSEGKLFDLDVADQLLVPIVNFFKTPDVGKLLQVIPLRYRNGAFAASAPLVLGPFQAQASWLLGTENEFESLVQNRATQSNAFVDSLDDDGVAILKTL